MEQINTIPEFYILNYNYYQEIAPSLDHVVEQGACTRIHGDAKGNVYRLYQYSDNQKVMNQEDDFYTQVMT